MFSLRRWLHRPKKTDTQLLAKLYYADDELNAISMELDSFDGRQDPERCTVLVNQLRNSQDKVLGLIENIMECAIPNERANRDFRAKFPDDVLQDSLAGQLWFGAECLAAGSTIMQREIESAALRPLARALIGSLDSLRNMLKEQSLKNINNYSDKVKAALKHFDVIFAEFELSYVSAMVPVKTALDYDTQQDVIILFCETVDRAVKENLLTQEMIDDYDAALMFTLPRLVIVCGLVIFPDGPLNVDVPADKMSELFRPYQNVLRKIRELLYTLTSIELHLLEKALSSTDLSWEDIEKELIALNGTSASQAIPVHQRHINNHVQSPIRSLGHNDMFGQSPASVSTLTERSTLCSSFPTDYDLDQVMPKNSHGNDFSDQMLEYLVADSIPLSNGRRTSEDLPSDNIQKIKDAKENVNNKRDILVDDKNSLPTIQVENTTETNGDDVHMSHKRCRRSSERRRSSGSNNGGQYRKICNGDLSSTSLEKDSTLTEEGEMQCNIPESRTNGEDITEKALMSKNNADTRTSESGTGSELSDKEAVKKYYLTANGRNRSTGNTECSSREGSDDAGTTLGRKGSEPDENVVLECKARLRSQECRPELEFPRTENNKHTTELNKKSTLCLETCSDYTMTRFLSDLENVDYYDHTENQNEMLLEDEDCNTDVFYLSKVPASDSSHDNINGIRSHTRSPSVASTGSSMSSLSQNRIVGHHAGAGLRTRFNDNPSDDGEDYDDDDECSTCSCSTCALSEAQNEDFKWESDDSDSDSTSYLSDNHDDREIAMAIEAAEQAAKEEARSRFSSTSDLVHRLFVCVAGVADQLQSNYASDLRNILKTVFEVKCLDPFDLSNLVQTLPENNQEEETATFLNHVNPSASAPTEVFEERHRHGSGQSGRGMNGEELCSRHNSGDRRVRHNSNHSGRVAGDEKRRHNSTRSRNKSGQRVEGLPSWQPDEHCTHCFACKSQFTVLRRKHHCRNCGKIFCARCSANSVPLPRYGQRKAVRVCNRCYMFHVTPFQQ